jgi:hypothetical protein
VGGGPSLDGVMDGDGSIDENEVVCAVDRHVDDVGIGPLETLDALPQNNRWPGPGINKISSYLDKCLMELMHSSDVFTLCHCSASDGPNDLFDSSRTRVPGRTTPRLWLNGIL